MDESVKIFILMYFDLPYYIMKCVNTANTCVSQWTKCLMYNVPKFHISKNIHLRFKTLQCSNATDWKMYWHDFEFNIEITNSSLFLTRYLNEAGISLYVSGKISYHNRLNAKEDMRV